WSSSDSWKTLRELFEEIAALKAWHGKRVVVVMDDPLSYGTVSPRDVAAAARTVNVPILLLAAVRTSEWQSWEYSGLVGPLAVVIHEQLPDALDGDEWSRLRDYLITLGVSNDRAGAEKSLSEVKSHSSQDTLSMLYYLLPQTRATIASAIRDEYFRLGDIAGLTKVIIKAAQMGSEILKRAYEMVAVADHYRGRLPMEVLVSALGVDYGEWRDATRPHSAAWGLLYEEESEELQT